MNKLNYGSKSLLLALKLLLGGSLMNISYFVLHIGEEKIVSLHVCGCIPVIKDRLRKEKKQLRLINHSEVRKGMDKGLGTQRKESNS